MRRRYKQQPDGSLVEIKPISPPGGTYQVGDIPDITKDCERHKAERMRDFHASRKETLINIIRGNHERRN